MRNPWKMQKKTLQENGRKITEEMLTNTKYPQYWVQKNTWGQKKKKKNRKKLETPRSRKLTAIPKVLGRLHRHTV